MTPRAIDSPCSLAAAVRGLLSATGTATVAVDGYDGRGKTAVARRLAIELQAQHIDGDDYIEDGTKAYPAILDLRRLKADIDSWHQTGKSIVFSSVLALDVLDAISIEASCHVYIRHSWPLGTLTDGDILYPERSTTELLEEENELCKAAGIGDDKPALGRELLHYHLNRRPHQIADLIFDVCFDTSAA